MKPDDLDKLLTRIPSAWLIDGIRRIDEAAQELSYDEFLEPVSVIDLDDKGKHTIEYLDADRINAWCKHIAYSMRIRLRVLEPGIVREFASGTVLAGQVLLRSHLEATAMAALCFNTLKAGDSSEIASLIPKTLFGTALLATAKHDDRIDDFLSYAATRTITIRRAMVALHKFAYQGGGDDNTNVAYSLLCEAAHPNHGGTKQFVTSKDVDETGDNGWVIRYSDTEVVPTESLRAMIELLLFSMSAGYAATEFLRNMIISKEGDGWTIGVSNDLARTIWSVFLSRAKPDE